MTIEEARQQYGDVTGYVSCDKCPLKSESYCEFSCDGRKKAWEAIVEYMNSLETDKTYNVISKPKHYCREGAMECIDEMLLVFGVGAVKNFCLCNWLKYRYRATDKNGEEDLKKSDWYLRKYKELCNGAENI